MREIKFRAWDKAKNEMLCWEILSAQCYNVVADADSGSNWVLLQFTGLLDKNGKEIYEGDILRGHDDGLVKVVWRGAGWQCDFEDDGNIGLDEMCLWFGNNSEVIGNIYENPELVKESL